LKDAERHGKTGTAVGAADASDNASTSQERVESTIGDRQSSGSSPSVTTFARQSAPTSSASPFPGIATGSSFTTAAHKFAYASHTAKVMTTRGRPPKAAAPVKIHQGKIIFLPGDLWSARMASKPGESNITAFLWKQGCVFEPKDQITMESTADEVMAIIIAGFQKKWDLTVNGFQYGRVIGSDHELLPSETKAKDMDGSALGKEYRESCCYIVDDKRTIPHDIRTYFFPDFAPPPPEKLARAINNFSECAYCLLPLPRTYIIDHEMQCDRKLNGYDSIPRKLGPNTTACGGLPLDYSHAFFRSNLAGIHLPEDFLSEDPKEERNTRIKEFEDLKAWCLCKGMGQALTSQWIQCASEEKCPVRWYHDECILAGARFASIDDIPDDWQCMLCIVAKQITAAGKRRKGKAKGTTAKQSTAKTSKRRRRNSLVDSIVAVD
ncbi:hypothetical protein CF335_g8911, partial [Tilletia laevis]